MIIGTLMTLLKEISALIANITPRFIESGVKAPSTALIL